MMSEYFIKPIVKTLMLHSQLQQQIHHQAHHQNKKTRRKKNGKVVLDGSENWNYGTSGVTGIMLSSIRISSMLSGNYLDGLATYFHNDKSAKAKNSIRFGADSKYIYLYLDETEYTSASDFKTWLSTHNTIVYYVLATPTTTEITQENYPTLYSQLLAIQEFLTKYKINKEFLLDYSSPEIEY